MSAEVAAAETQPGNLPFTLTDDVDEIFDFASITIKLASPDRIRSWSNGEVKKPETINYRTFRPERDGLFCERIFGPTKDYECYCGKYKSIRYRGMICDRCGVEVSRSEVRRERMGHVELVAPVAHIWYFKRIPSQMSILLDVSVKNLERVLYFEEYIVVRATESMPFKVGDVIGEEEFRMSREKYSDDFSAEMGAEAVKKCLQALNLEELAVALRNAMKDESSVQKKKKIIRRLGVINSFLKSGNKPEWMILDAVPVIPPELRPMVQLDGGRFATSDLNDLYRRVINRNNRLQRLLDLKAPEIIIRNEKRMLQEAVDTLFDNSRRGRGVKGPGSRPLKSLSDILKGKRGRFRQNLLGKRVDYSGRSVIVVDPRLKLYQCGLPKKMAIELFKPFIMKKLVDKGLVHNIKSAKRMIEREDKEIWDALEEVIVGHPVLLNRAPTLHRAGFQAFEPILVEGEAIKIHPLVCTAFNADFDGDQMAVHVPLSIEAQLECEMLMLSIYNILSPANGDPLVVPSQDIVLGCCYLTKDSPRPEKLRSYLNFEEVLAAHDAGILSLHTLIEVRMTGSRIKTTTGRLILNEILPPEIGFINKMVNKRALSEIIYDSYRKIGLARTVDLLDKIKKLGFEYATRYGGSISIDDIKIPSEKKEILERGHQEVEKTIGEYQQGLITEEERYNRIVDIWTSLGEEVADASFKQLAQDINGFNPIYIMVESGARGSKQQIRQLAGMRGLMAKPSGEIIELPITANFREGLSVLEYFISTHGARKGLADTALKTADAGYLTRRLVDIAQDVIVTEVDCGTMNGMVIEAIKEGDEIIESLKERILGRVTVDEIADPMSGEIMARTGEEIKEEAAKLIEEAEIERVRIRSVLTCESSRGVCAKCYGRNLATGRLIDIGEAVGIIAAQSIGEPGTQLTMRTFHIGGTAFRQVEEREARLDYPVEIVSLPKHIIPLQNEKGMIVARGGDMVVRKILKEYVLPPGSKIMVFDGLWINLGEVVAETSEGKSIKADVAGIGRITEEGKVLIEARERRIPLRTGSKVYVKTSDLVEAGQIIAEFDPYNELILTETTGEVKYKDIIKGRTLREERDENTGLFNRVVVEDREGELQATVDIIREDGKMVNYILPHGSRIVVNDGQKLAGGDTLAKFPQALSKTKDITGGLPRVAELFETRCPRDNALIAEIDGVVEFKEIVGGTRTVRIRNKVTNTTRDYSLPVGKHLKIHEGDEVKAGDQLVEGPIDPQDILRIKGDRALQQYLLNEVQEVYKLQGVNINDKHIEVIVRQMLRRVEVTSSGDTDFLAGDHLDKFRFMAENKRVITEGGTAAQARPLLMGITKASLATDSFISAASFQETTRVLTEAAIKGRVDELIGLKENVIIGRLIPAGTGMPQYKDKRFKFNRLKEVKAVTENEKIEEEEQQQQVQAQELVG
ncbi:MAG: DNA-directed RNA polymerase subunit beta' [bacterium]|nr:DNA-directed RNA polymerase subunit beta' [bacterium]